MFLVAGETSIFMSSQHTVIPFLSNDILFCYNILFDFIPLADNMLFQWLLSYCCLLHAVQWMLQTAGIVFEIIVMLGLTYLSFKIFVRNSRTIYALWYNDCSLVMIWNSCSTYYSRLIDYGLLIGSKWMIPCAYGHLFGWHSLGHRHVQRRSQW